MQAMEQNPTRLCLDRIPGLDVERGLKTVGGRVESLARLLRRYEEVHAEDIHVLREGGDSAQRLAHSLKGATGFLGLAAIQDLVGRLEVAFREGAPQDQIGTLLEAFERENQALCAAIRALPVLP